MMDLNKLGGAAAAKPEVKESDKPKEFAPVRYTCHPIQRFTIGDFKFEESTLTLDNEKDADAFAKILEELPPIERYKIKKIDLAAAEALIKKMRDESGGATKVTDSSVGDRTGAPKVGTDDLLAASTKGAETT